MKKGISVTMEHDAVGNLLYVVRKTKRRGSDSKLTLEEIKDAMMEYEQDYYGLVLRCMDGDTSQYYDDDLREDAAELYPIEMILEEWKRARVK